MSDHPSGYANQATFDLVVAYNNHEELYRATVAYAGDLLERVPGMTPQTMGRNVKDQLFAWAFGGGWGRDNAPRFTRELGHLTRDDYALINEEDIGDDLLETLEG